MMIMAPVDREQLFRELNDIKELVGGVNDRLDVQNGRLRRVETWAAISKWASGVAGATILAGLGWWFR